MTLALVSRVLIPSYIIFVEDKFFQPAFKRMNYNGTLRLIAVGNLKYQKNYPYLIEAFKKLPKSIRLDIYGSGELAYQLQEEIDKFKLHNIRIVWRAPRH